MLLVDACSRSGPYASAVLRFQIRFPDSYPNLPPLVTFATDVFHPLIVPLTTYTFSTGASSEDPVSATDEERLPPGGFSLRHGFPHWFGRAKKSGINSTASSRTVSHSGSGVVPGDKVKDTATENSPNETEEEPSSTTQPQEDRNDGESNGDRIAAMPSADQFREHKESVPVSVLLNYIRSTFDDETVLDSLPLEAAGNPSAWHAWRAHRHGSSSSALKKGSPQTRLPGDWHWDGIWAKRVRSEIESSNSDQMLFGNVTRGGSDEMV